MKQYFYRTLMAAMMLGASVTVVEMTQAQVATQQAPVNAKKQLTLEQRVEKRLEQMKKNLELSDAQVTQLRAILREDMSELKNARMTVKDADTKEARKAARDDFKAQAKTTKDRIAAVLTAEQQAKMEANMKGRRHEMKERMQERRAKNHEMKQELKQERRDNK